VSRNVKSKALWIIALLGATLLSGCGVDPGVMVDSGKTQKDLRLNKGLPGTQQGASNDQAIIQALFNDMRQTRSTLRNVQCDLTGFFVSDKDGSVGSMQARFCYELPNKTSLLVKQSSDGSTVGTKMVWSGGKQIAVKTKLLGFWLKTSVDVHDGRTADHRGYFIDETGINPMMDTFFDPRNQVSLIGQGTLGNTPIIQIGIVSPRSLKGVAREVFTIDTQRKMPMVREMYNSGNRLVYRIRMDNIIMNATMPSTTFSLD
jgi:hypothetical protein